jgi:betaine-aldehyde dehydrogenase
MKTYPMLIDGALVEGSGGQIVESVNPATEQPIANVCWGEPADATRAVDAAYQARTSWQRTTLSERSSYLRELNAKLRAHADELAMLDVLDNGSPHAIMSGDVHAAIATSEYFAGLAPELKGVTLPSETDGMHLTVREPYGVVVKIIPFNHPLMFAVTKIVGPLVAGNTVVLKPPPQTPLSSLRLGELIAEVFPPGVVNIVPGDGPTVGNALVTDPRVHRIGFTGSLQTGRVIARAAAEHMAEVTLELGGKNPMIVFPDADPDLAADAAVAAMNFAWLGQSCGSSSRLYLHRDIAGDVEAALARRLSALRQGDPTDPATEVGTMVSKPQYDRVMNFIDSAHQDGAKVLVGGGRPTGAGFDRGHWIEPTVFTNVPAGARIAREEIFGPVLSVFEWDDEDQVIAAANDTNYGLTANVWTNDLGTALRVVPQLQAGYVWVNGRGEHYLGLPFGGFKESGQGREGSLEELLSYTQTKSLSLLPAR